MARDDQGWNSERSRREGNEPGRDRPDLRDRNPRQGFSQQRGGDWGDADDYYGNRGSEGSNSRSGRTGGGSPNEGAWDEGQPGGRNYGQGMYNPKPGSQGQEGFGSNRGEWGQQGWGNEQSRTNRGSDLGRSGNRYGNTGDDNYGGGGFQGGSGYGGSSGFSAGGGYQANWGQQQQQQRDEQNHAGRGPKGWKRSDERIREDVNDQLERHPQIDASDIEVRVEDGEVILSGTVNDRRTKRLAEDVVENIAGVKDVQNHVRVKREGGVLSRLFGTDDESGNNQADGQSTAGQTDGSTAENVGTSSGTAGQSGTGSASTSGAPGSGSMTRSATNRSKTTPEE